MDVAFRNPDGTTVLVAHNENDNPQAFGVLEGDRSFTYTLPGDSLATFTWPGNPGGRQGLTELDPSGWKAVANPPGPTDPCCQGDVALNAVDDDASTRYSTGTGQQPGQYLQVDFGRARAGARDRLRHRRQPRRLSPRLHRDRQLRRRHLEHGGRRRDRAPASSPSCRCRAHRSGSCA